MKHLLMSTFLAILFTGLATAQDKKRSDAEKAAIEKIRKSGGLALEIAQNDPRLEVSFLSMDGKITADHLKLLKDLKDVIHLNLRGREVTDDMLVHLKDMKSLTRLHLEKTKVTDKGMPHLKGLTNLEYLNLYGTAVTDKGIEALAGLTKLKRLYLWQTKVTDAGEAKLKKALPKTEIIRGFTVAKPKPEPKPEPKKDKPAPKKDKPAPKKDKPAAKDKDKPKKK